MRVRSTLLWCIGWGVFTVACSKPVPQEQLDYVGLWEASDMRLLIRADGRVSYARTRGASCTALNLPLRSFDAHGFTVGVWPLATSFKVDSPPALRGGVWTMSVDGVTLRRTAEQFVAAGGAGCRPLQEWEAGCQGGDTTDCFNLALAHRNGDGVTKSPARSAELFDRACAAGMLPACNELGVAYAEGQGVEANMAMAVGLMRRACDGDELLGCSNLGRMYSQGEGVEKDLTTAVRLFRKACEGGGGQGCTKLGILHENGEGVDQDAALAVAFYGKACAGDDAEGCHYLGVNHVGAIGVAKDLQRARELFRKGCDLGWTDSCDALREVGVR